MKVVEQVSAPDLRAEDVFGKSIDLKDLAGKKVLVCFHRFVGCPVCNLRVHSLEQINNEGVQVIHIYESKSENLKKYLVDTSFKAAFIADPKAKLFKTWGVQKSWYQFVIGFLKAGAMKGMKGMQLFKGGIKGMQLPDSAMNRIPADFIIDENGLVQTAYYGKFFGDELPIATINQALAG